MAEISKEVLGEKKVTTIADFRKNYAGGVSAQAINYAIEHDLVDYMEVGKRVRIIVLTPKSIQYTPNESPKRTTRMSLGKK